MGYKPMPQKKAAPQGREAFARYPAVPIEML
jgi:hypothetical protein